MSEITINVKVQSSGKEFSVTISTEATVKTLKEKCVEGSGVPVEEQRLIFKGRILKDENTLADSKVENGVTINLASQNKEAASTNADSGST